MKLSLLSAVSIIVALITWGVLSIKALSGPPLGYGSWEEYRRNN